MYMFECLVNGFHTLNQKKKINNNRQLIGVFILNEVPSNLLCYTDAEEIAACARF